MSLDSHIERDAHGVITARRGRSQHLLHCWRDAIGRRSHRLIAAGHRDRCNPRAPVAAVDR
jgi:hypothetical protein